MSTARSDSAPLLDALAAAGADVSKPQSIRCPFHDDTQPSAGIFEGEDGAWRFKCHACEAGGDVFDIRSRVSGRPVAEELREAGGRGASHATRNSKKHAKRSGTLHPTPERAAEAALWTVRQNRSDDWTSSEAWRYQHHGREYARVLRFDAPNGGAKTFVPIHRDGDGWRVGDPSRWRPYLIDEVHAADVSRPAYIFEGEKCADAGAAVGLLSITSAHGSKSPQRTDWSELAGRDVVIWPDKDKPGRAYAEAVAAILSKLDPPATVRIVTPPDDLPEGGDVADYVEARECMDTDEIRAAIEALAIRARPWAAQVVTPVTKTKSDCSKSRTFIMRRGDEIDDEGTSYLWRRRVPRGAVTVIFSRPGRGKSTLAADMTGHITTGKPWPDGSPCPQGTVIYIKGEGTDAAIRDRMKMAGADPTKYVLISKADDDDSPMIDLAEDAGPLQHALDQLPDTRLIIIDTLDSLYPSMRMIDNANIRKCLWPLQEIAEARNLAVVIFAHTNKGGYADPLDRLSGGRAIGGAARAIWYLGKVDPEAEQCVMAAVKCNDFIPAEALAYEIVGGNPDSPGAIRWLGESDTGAWDLDGPQKIEAGSAKADACEQWLRDLLADGPVPTSNVLQQAQEHNFGARVLRKAKAALETRTVAAKGTRPPVHFVCLPGQTAPELSSTDNEKAQAAGGAHDPQT